MDKSENKIPGILNRRDFFKMGAASAAMLGTVSACSKKEGQAVSAALVPRKVLGKTGMQASVLAMGGGSALSMVKSDEEALALIDLARRKGINYFDSGSDYGGGKSEIRFGQALAPFRKEIYLSTKYGSGTNPDELKKKVETTLERFRTDYVDVANMHGLAALGDVDKMFASGALETLVKLKEEGVVKNIGVTSHGHPPALLEALKRFNFDTCLMAANASKVPFIGEFEQAGDSSFEELCLPLALEQGIGIWAFKIMGQRRLIAKGAEPDKAPAAELIRYAMSLPVHGVILGMNAPEHVLSAVDTVTSFKPMTKEEMRSWNERLAAHANDLSLDYLRRDYRDDGGWRAHLV